MTHTSHRRPPAPRAVLLGAVSLLLAACSAAGATPSPSPAATAAAAACPTAQPAALAAGESRTVTIETAKGAIAIKIEANLSPIAAGNFVALAGCGAFDGAAFYRTATLDDGTPFVIQGGPANDFGYTIQDEPVTTTYKRGTVAMARSDQPNSVSAHFFIVLDDRDADILSFYNTYQIIGTVTSGMDAVDAIYAASNGQEQPPNPIAMTKVTVSNP